MKKIAVFPGSFDPFTKGHESVVKKAVDLFDEVIIGIGFNTSKNYLFDLQQRKTHIQSIFQLESKVKVQEYTGMTVDFCKQVGAEFIVRGLRDTKDFEYERSIAQMNLEISGIESVFFMTVPEFAAINATIVREIYKSGGKIDAFVTNSELLVTK
ncbi:MAG: pantetheine-phosphate adenylyltransferase [Brumimicrobium sp.]|nr:pantetheine-phosphate adenylyltransferase [Brumimicrobium sp.]MCO5268640.1 pantetheine-phosphate adenylyltransferase [Brumimicrobium sp.]